MFSGKEILTVVYMRLRAALAMQSINSTYISQITVLFLSFHLPSLIMSLLRPRLGVGVKRPIGMDIGREAAWIRTFY